MISIPLLVLCVIITARTTYAKNPKLDQQTRTQMAQAHYERVLSSVMCGVPQPRVVRMETTELRVLPPATLIHRCGDSTGCCDSSIERCVAKTKERVKLFFFVKPRTAKRNRRHRVKKLTFVNHTQCHCVDMRDIPR